MRAFLSRIKTSFFNQNEKYFLLEVFIISLLVRLIYLFMVGGDSIRINNDEVGYFNRALAFADIIKGYNSDAIINFFYSQGYWPPLHPIILGLTIAVTTSKIFVCRLMIIVLGSATSLMLYKFSRLFLNKKQSLSASFLHILHPSFIAFSIALWSETTYILFLVTTLYFTFKLIQDKSGNTKQIVINAFFIGIFLGLSGLSRAITILILPVIITMFVFKFKNLKLKIYIPTIILAATLLIWSPWIIYASIKEGKPVLLSTQLGYNLALGNKVELPQGFSFSSKGKPVPDTNSPGLEQVNTPPSIQDDPKTAFDSFRRDSSGAVKRSLTRIRLLLSFDYISLRSLFTLQYSILPYWFAGTLLLFFIIYHLIYFTMILMGFIYGFRDKIWVKLLFLTAIVSIAGPVFTIASPRHSLAAFVISAPVAVLGFTNFDRVKELRGILTYILSFTAVLIITLSPTRIITRNYLVPSYFYSPVLNPVTKLFNLELKYSDNLHILMKKSLTSENDIEIVLDEPNSTDVKKRTLVQGNVTILPITQQSNQVPPTLRITDSQDINQEIQLLDKTTVLGQWEATGLPGIIYKWDYTGADSETIIRKYLRFLQYSRRLEEKKDSRTNL